MTVCQLRTVLLIVCVLELIVTVERQIFDFLGYMWLPIIANFMNILLIIFGCFGAVQYVTKYLLAYTIWSILWVMWNAFLICFYLDIGSLNRESGLLSMGTGSVSWWESNGWGCQPVWGEVEGPGTWRPMRVDGCLLPWPQVELAQSALAGFLAALAFPLTAVLSYRASKRPSVSEKDNATRRPIYTIELSPAETVMNESSLKPMTPRRVKRRSGTRGAGSSVRRSRRSYRNAGYIASTASLPRDPRSIRPTSAHSSYSNYHGARPASYHAIERDPRSNDAYDAPPPVESVPVLSSGYDTVGRRTVSPGYDVAGPYDGPSRNCEPNLPSYDTTGRGYEMAAPSYDAVGSRMEMAGSPCEGGAYGGAYGVHDRYAVSDMHPWEAPPPPAPPYCARATPQAPGPPAYQPTNDNYGMRP